MRLWIARDSPRERSNGPDLCPADTSSSSPSLAPSPGGALLLADEPTGNLDSKSGEALMQMFGELYAGGATVCLATHDPRWVTQAQRHLYLFDGRLVDHPVSDV